MADKFRIGTYNVENLFDRFDDPYFAADDPWGYRASKPKKQEALYNLGARIRASNVDILALQEVENYGALKNFSIGHIGNDYKARDGIVSIQSNDPRGIDLGVLSKFPFGRITSHRHLRLTDGGTKRFSRDCLEVEVLKKDRSEVLLTIYNCHLKSKYSKYDPEKEPDKYEADQRKSADKRILEAEKIIEIIKAKNNIENDMFVVCGDFNDTPDSESLNSLLGTDNELQLVNATSTLADSDYDGNSLSKRPRDTHKWTRRDEEGFNFSTYSQIDYLLCSKALWAKSNGTVKVEQRNNTGGSDHYLSYAEFEL